MPSYTKLALYADSEHNGGRLRTAAQQLGLTVLDVPRDPADLRLHPGPGLAWRAPVGLVAALVVRGTAIRLTAAGSQWFASLPPKVLGRRLSVVDAAAVAALPRSSRYVSTNRSGAAESSLFARAAYTDNNE